MTCFYSLLIVYIYSYIIRHKDTNMTMYDEVCILSIHCNYNDYYNSINIITKALTADRKRKGAFPDRAFLMASFGLFLVMWLSDMCEGVYL